LTDFDLVIAAPSRIGAGQLGPLDLQLFRYVAPGRQTLRALSVLPAPSTRLICTIAFPVIAGIGRRAGSRTIAAAWRHGGDMMRRATHEF
jgi:hypothetical protein